MIFSLREWYSRVVASVGFILPRLFVLLIACNYIAFRVELFAEEYERVHPAYTGSTESVSSSSTTWESFDKDNAPKAFAFQAQIILTMLGVRGDALFPPAPHVSTSEPIRDKSPPVSSLPN